MGTLGPLTKPTNVQQLGLGFQTIRRAYEKWKYRYQEYREYGLYHDDMYRDNHPEVAEAVRRLPEDLFTARVHRQHRAIQLSRNKIILPDALWPDIDDPNHRYLTPYLDEVAKELKEKAEWNKK